MKCPYIKHQDGGFFGYPYSTCDSSSNKGNKVSDYERCTSDEYKNCPYYANVNRQHSVSVHTSRTVKVKCPCCGKELIVNID